jgi:hypothetical protein
MQYDERKSFCGLSTTIDIAYITVGNWKILKEDRQSPWAEYRKRNMKYSN